MKSQLLKKGGLPLFVMFALLAVTVLLPWTRQADANSALQSKVLLFSKTEGFRHGSIPNAIAAIETLGADNGFTVDKTEDATLFTEANLAQYDAVVWVMTTGNVLNETQQAAFEQYIRGGGGYVGIHSASDTEYDWPWYGDLMGAFFQDHPAIQTATVNIEDGTHPSTAHLEATWVRNDEWYNYRTNPRSNSRTTTTILMTLDESSYSGGNMGDDHPIAWYHEFDGGRAWYTGGGHTNASYSETDFVQHILGGIQYAADINDAPVSTPTVIASPTLTSTATVTPSPTGTPVNTPLPSPLPCFVEHGGTSELPLADTCSFLPLVW